MSSKVNELKNNLRKLGQEIPSIMGAFGNFNKEVVKEGVLNHKIKELMALAIGLAIRCDHCIRYHTAEAVKAGATRAEILDTAGVAILMGGGPVLINTASVLFELLDELEVK